LAGGNVFDQMANFAILNEYSPLFMESMDFITENLQEVIDLVTTQDLENKRDKVVSVWQRQKRVSEDDSDFVTITNITRSLVVLTLKCLSVSH
jgi:hypothetical protein